MYNKVLKTKNPKFLVITPLKENDEISMETYNSVLQNSTEFNWVSYSANNNIPTNTKLGLEEYEKENKKLPYIIKIDNDVVFGTNTLSYMYNCIKNSEKKIGYVYCNFDYIKNNRIFASFKFLQFNGTQLKKSNYISSVSMIKRNVLEKVGGFITNNKYKRLLDYALWLKMLNQGYIGKLSQGYFKAIMSENSISNGSDEEYKKVLREVHRDFI